MKLLKCKATMSFTVDRSPSKQKAVCTKIMGHRGAHIFDLSHVPEGSTVRYELPTSPKEEHYLDTPWNPPFKGKLNG